MPAHPLRVACNVLSWCDYCGAVGCWQFIVGHVDIAIFGGRIAARWERSAGWEDGDAHCGEVGDSVEVTCDVEDGKGYVCFCECLNRDTGLLVVVIDAVGL